MGQKASGVGMQERQPSSANSSNMISRLKGLISQVREKKVNKLG